MTESVLGPDRRPPWYVRVRRRTLLFRVLAIALGLLPLFACELILRAFDLGRPSLYDDPFVGFSAVRPLFELNTEKDRVRDAAGA